MSQRIKNSGQGDEYQNDHRLIQAYREATTLDQGGLEALCPSYMELSKTSTRYEDEELLGKGGVKKVYRSLDNHTQRWVAMARLREDHGPEFYDLFVNEAWLTSSLNHPNIINIHDVGIDHSGRPFFTMDLKGNTTLADLINSNAFERRDLLRDFLKICDAVAYAHSKEVIHLDLKPENIQTESFGEVLVCDWGLGKLVGHDDEETMTSSTEVRDNMTLVGEIKGTLGYMAPEQVEADGEKDHRTDIFSLGCILHAILTGEPPFKGKRRAVLEATSRGILVDPSETYPSLNIPQGLGAVTVKALAKNPDDRYQSVYALRDDVQRYLDGFSTDAEAPNFLREARLFVSRNRTPVLISFLSFIFLTVLSTLFVQRTDSLRADVSNKSQLAKQYATEVDLANELYSETLADSKEQQLALSESLLFSIRRLKSRGIFQTPMKSIREAKELATHAHALDPESRAAKYQLFALNMIQLNFKEALKYPQKKNSDRYSYMLLAESFSEFDYDRHKRPSVETLRDFLRKARKIAPRESALIERIISYDAALRPLKDSNQKVILEFLYYLNPESEVIELEYFASESVVHLRSEKALTLVSARGGSGECVLRYLMPRSLVLEVQDEVNLSALRGLAINELDLTGCASIRLEGPLALPSINVIKIDPQKHSSDQLRKWVESSGDFKIIESNYTAPSFKRDK